MIILITGIAGFIGSHLAEELLKNPDNTIIGVDNFYSGTKENLDFLQAINPNNQIKFYETDIRDYPSIHKIIQENRIQQIYHLAAIVSVQESIKNPLFTHDVNVRGTLNILEAARKNNVKRIVFSSSAAVYGNNPILPKHEASTTDPISPYGNEKLICEQYMKLYTYLYKTETIILRYFNVYGERQHATNDYSGVISIFSEKIKTDQLITIYGDGSQYRDFIYVKDVVAVNIIAMNAPNISTELFCVGTGEKTSIKELFQVMCNKYRKSIKPIFQPIRNGDILESVCDNNKIQSILNIKDFYSLEYGISKI